MNRPLRPIAFLLALLAAWAFAGSARAQISEAQAEQLMKVSGGWAQIASMAPAMKQALREGLMRPGGDVDDATKQRILAAAEQSFDAAPMRAAARRTLAEGVRADYVPELLAWFASETGRRITRAEEAASADGSRAATEDRMRAGVAVLQAATPERRALLSRVVEATRAGPTGADFIVNLALVTQTSMARLNPKVQAPDEAKLRAELDGQRPQLMRAFEAMALAGFALAYRELPDESLAAYATFMSGAAGDHFTDLSARAFEAALLSAFGSLGR